jgi:hypothetical protein
MGRVASSCVCLSVCVFCERADQCSGQRTSGLVCMALPGREKGSCVAPQRPGALSWGYLRGRKLVFFICRCAPTACRPFEGCFTCSEVFSGRVGRRRRLSVGRLTRLTRALFHSPLGRPGEGKGMLATCSLACCGRCSRHCWKAGRCCASCSRLRGFIFLPSALVLLRSWCFWPHPVF